MVRGLPSQQWDTCLPSISIEDLADAVHAGSLAELGPEVHVHVPGSKG